ncbi:MAG TPA: DUF3106 domain-containing protein [Acidisarcina sp.]
MQPPAYGGPQAPGYGPPAYGRGTQGGQNSSPVAPNVQRYPSGGYPQAPYENRGYQNPAFQTAPNGNQGYQPRQPYTGSPKQQPPSGDKPGQQHLGDWLDRHQTLSPQEKERALESEPGFNRLAPQQQQRLVQRLHDLDNMPAGQRERTLQRVENMERLSPEQRDQVRGAASQLRTMPQDRQRAVRRAFQDLRNVPPGLRSSELQSPRFAGQFSPEERSVLGNLLSVEPYEPQPAPPR